MFQFGLKVKMGKNICVKYGFVVGIDEQCFDDLYMMFLDCFVDVVWCVRGGYGCICLLFQIDYEFICKNFKILIGYSDIIVLFNVIYYKIGLVIFYGLVGVFEFLAYIEVQVRVVLMEGVVFYFILLFEGNEIFDDLFYQLEVIWEGQVEGVLMGGNLFLLVVMIGIGYLFDLIGVIVFMEDVGEVFYWVDCMFI